MTCESCKKETEPLASGQCLGCIVTENATLRLLVAHMITAIEGGQSTVHPTFGRCYVQEFGEAFVEHLRISLGIIQSNETPPLGTLTRRLDEHQDSPAAQA
jgi:hypothetical protein